METFRFVEVELTWMGLGNGGMAGQFLKEEGISRACRSGLRKAVRAEVS